MTSFASCLSAAAPDAALLPEWHLENLAGLDGSLQRSLVFTSVPGVVYRFETSHDLVDWEPAGDDFYGLGHQHAFPLVEVAAPPPPEPGAPAFVPPPPMPHVSIPLRKADAPGGGLALSWRSLDDTRPVSVRIDATLDPAWSSHPLFFDSAGGHAFFIFYMPGTWPDCSSKPSGTRRRSG